MATVSEPGLHWQDDSLFMRTENFVVEPGGERYLCWAISTKDALKIDAIQFAGSRAVHHLTLAQTVTPEPEGFSECETLLKPTWRPLFSAGAGANKLTLPKGTAHQLAAGTQLVVQVHLFNAASEPLNDAVQLELQITEAADTQPVEIGGFGSMVIALPPGAKSTVTHECTLPHAARIVALMPHMHQLATSLKLELGSSANDLTVAYSRESWNFDQQTIDSVDMSLQQGQYARVTCAYDNTTGQTVTYGESTNNEMCFLGAFWVGTPINCVRFF